MKQSKDIQRTIVRFITCVLILSFMAGCATPPSVYTMPNDELEQMRDEIHSVAVVRGRYKSLRQFDLPAKGVLPAGGRGFVSGVGATIAVGVVSPIPGGSVLGVILSPIGGIVGFFRGMIVAEPASKVEAAEKTLLKAAEKLQAMNLSDDFRDRLIRAAEERTSKEFIFHEEFGPRKPEETAVYDQADFPNQDAVLEIRPLRAGLWGLWTVNPPASPFAEVGIRLIRLSDGKVLIDDVIMCAGEERSYDEWATQEDLFVEEFLKCIPRLVEKVVDDTFLTTALARRR